MNPLISPSSDVLAHTKNTSAMGELVILQGGRERKRWEGRGKEEGNGSKVGKQ